MDAGSAVEPSETASLSTGTAAVEECTESSGGDGVITEGNAEGRGDAGTERSGRENETDTGRAAEEADEVEGEGEEEGTEGAEVAQGRRRRRRSRAPGPIVMNTSRVSLSRLGTRSMCMVHRVVLNFESTSKSRRSQDVCSMWSLYNDVLDLFRFGR